VKLLIVDDSSLFRDRVRRHVQNNPAIDVVGEASNGADALLELERLRPDVMLLDLEMPPPDGYSVLRAAKLRFQDTKVVILTGNASVSARECCCRLLADAVIDKADTAALVIPTLLRLAGQPDASTAP
jgi:DNA-binding NarL/FixJ family response regulator